METPAYARAFRDRDKFRSYDSGLGAFEGSNPLIAAAIFMARGSMISSTTYPLASRNGYTMIQAANVPSQPAT